MIFIGPDGTQIALNTLDAATDVVRPISVVVVTRGPGQFDSEHPFGEFDFATEHRTSLDNYFQPMPESRRRRLTVPISITLPGSPSGARVAQLLFPDLENAMQDARDIERWRKQPASTPNRPTVDAWRTARLAVSAGMSAEWDLDGGIDGVPPSPADYEGHDDGKQKFGLMSFEDVEDISIVSAPGYSALYASSATANQADQIESYLITHVEYMRYRVAVLDSGPNMALSEVREQRGKIDSKHAALYYPWIKMIDPLAPRGTPAAEQELLLPPSGFVSGIYARNDVERGVHKAPANEIVKGAIGFEFTLNKAQQDVLNPDGINCFRYFENRGNRLWGARTISSDPEWKYVNVRRYFAYLERSIEKGTQWAVFEGNAPPLWANVRRTVEDFLYNEWNNGALLGLKPEEAFFVRCDRTTITQNDLDNGRMICLIGVAPVKPAEFVIFRIGQWTGDRKQ